MADNDDLDTFFKEQQEIMEMSDEDLADYEVRFFNDMKRRKRDRTEEDSSDRPQDAVLPKKAKLVERHNPETHDITDTPKAPGSAEKSHAARPYDTNADPQPTLATTRISPKGGSTLSGAAEETSRLGHNADDLRENWGQSEAHVQPPLVLGTSHDGQGQNSTSRRKKAAPVAHSPKIGAVDSSLLPTIEQQDDGESTKVSKQQLSTPRDKVLKKLVPIVVAQKESSADSSNVTTPSTTPLPTARRSLASNARTTKTTGKVDREFLKAEKARKAAEEKARKLEEAKEKLMTPPEYAAKVLTKFQPLLDRTPPRKLFLKDKNIFYIGGDLKFASKTTRDKMDFVRKKGGTVVPVYDPSIVTHIVTDTTPIPTLKALALKSLTEIPDHIPTVLWSWITSGNRGKLEFEWMHAAFSSRIDADSSKRSSKGKEAQFPRQVAGTVSGGVTNSSVIEDFSDDHHPQTPSSSLHPSSAAPPFSSAANPPQRTRHASQQCNGPEGDPLAEYYALAAADQESAWPYDEESNDSSDGEMPMDEVVKQSRRGFTCDQRNTDNGHCLNQGIIDKLQELMELHKEKLSDHDRWRVFSYSKTIRALRNHPVQIKSYEQARAIKGVGDKTARKIEEIIQTGELRRIDWEKTPDVESIKNFKGIYDVGPHTAYQWYNAGCRTLDDVKARKGGITLTPTQKIGVEYYDDINSRMPRSEAEQIFNKIKPIALEIDPMLFIEIMGSFRRGKADCGDIDILITRPTHDGKTHAGVIRSLLTELHVRQIITEDLATPDNFDGLEATYRGLCRLDFRSRRRRIDILAVPYESRGAALLYYTGDDIFNRAIRYKAGSMGYSLNQRGLFTAVARDPNDRRKKLTKGYVIASETEEEIFKILNVPWQEPHERVRAV